MEKHRTGGMPATLTALVLGGVLSVSLLPPSMAQDAAGTGGTTGTAGTGGTAGATGPTAGPSAPGTTTTGVPGSAGPGANAPGTVAPTAANPNQSGVPANGAVTGALGTGSVGIATSPAGGSTGGSGEQAGADSPYFDVARTIQNAIANSAALQEARRTVEIERRRADEVASRARPNLDASASATRFDAKTFVSVGGQQAQVLGTHTEALSLNASEALDFLGTIRAETSQARLQALADTFTLTTVTNSRVLQAQTTYYNLLRATHQVQVAEASLRNAQEQQAVANKLYVGQIGQKIDVLRANTQVAVAEQNVAAATNNREIARAAFNDLVGRPLTAPVELQDVPGVTVGVDIAAASPSGGGAAGAPAATTPGTGEQNPGAPVGTPSPAFTPYPAPITETDAIDVDAAIATATAQRPEILRNATLVRASDVGVRIARSGLEPAFVLSAAGNYYPTSSFQFPRKRTAQLTVAVSIPIYDGGRTRDQIAEARLERENAQTALGSTREDVTLQVRESYLNLATAARQIQAAGTALQQAIAARQLAQVRYEGQVGLYLEVTDAQSALVQAENAQVDAVYNYLTARAQFENAVGTPAAGGAASGTAVR